MSKGSQDFGWLDPIISGIVTSLSGRFPLPEPEEAGNESAEIYRATIEAKAAIQDRFTSLEDSYKSDAVHHKIGLELLAKQLQADLLRARIDTLKEAYANWANEDEDEAVDRWFRMKLAKLENKK